MAKRTVYHFTYDKAADDWKLMKQGAKRATRRFKTKTEGLPEAVKLVRKIEPSQLKIHKRDGKIQEERTYGDDPEKYPG